MATDARDFRGTGAFNVNEQYATSVRFELAVDRNELKRVDLRFMNGRSELAAAQLSAAEARDVLGERNYGLLLKSVADAQAPGREEADGAIKGELRGKALEFRQVMLSGYTSFLEDNAILLDSRVRPNDEPAKAVGQGTERHVSRDDAVGGAPTVQATGVGAPAAQAAPASGAPDTAARVAATDVREQARLQHVRAHAVPDAVAERFLNVDGKYYFPDKKLAFVDRGTKLKAETNNVEVVRSIVMIAQTRGWEALTVTGTQDFRREVWREASLRGIDVRGYEPNDLERQALQRALEKRNGPNEIQREGRQQAVDVPARDGATAASPRTTMPDPASPAAPGTAHDSAPRSSLLHGRLLESGPAPYQFDPNKNPSYFVKVQTDNGERTLWGVDLERALAESRTGVKPGDPVSIENQGSKPVTVKVPVRNDSGQVMGEKQIKTHRNAWVVEKPSYFDERAEKAAALRNGERAKQELVAQYPDLTNAIATMRLGELFAEKLIDRPEDRRRVVSALRETLADAIERGETIQAPKIREATVRKLDKIAGEIDEVAQRAASARAVKGAREVGARAKEDLQHARA